MTRLPLAALAALLLLPGTALAQRTYIAFGDSLTQGIGDDEDRVEQGYPPRLAQLLEAAGESVVVLNRGRAGETTAEAITRIEDVLLIDGGDELLLMEGTNDISDGVSVETIRFNLSQIVDKARSSGLVAVLSTVPPRLSGARTDGDNSVTDELARNLRAFAWSEEHSLADPFEVLLANPDAETDLYVGGDDYFHLNAAGYDVLAGIFADLLLDVDNVPPVLGAVTPADGATEVAADSMIEVELFDFGAGIDLASTELLVDDTVVDPTFIGDERRYEITYQPAAPLRGVVDVVLRTGDLAEPSNTVERPVTTFTIAGSGSLPGDIDESGRVDGADLVILAIRFGSTRGDGRYRTFADLDDDGRVDGNDLAILAADFGRSVE